MEKKFKPFEKVLVRLVHNQEWQCDLYSHQDSITKYHTTVGYGEIKDDNILPYEGNEHLVGTDLPADEEVKLEEGEWVFCFDEMTEIEQGTLCCDKFIEIYEKWISCGCNNEGHTPYRFTYAIRFSDFNPNDMEETSRHILCVKNGRIVKYKG